MGLNPAGSLQISMSIGVTVGLGLRRHTYHIYHMAHGSRDNFVDTLLSCRLGSSSVVDSLFVIRCCRVVCVPTSRALHCVV